MSTNRCGRTWRRKRRMNSPAGRLISRCTLPSGVVLPGEDHLIAFQAHKALVGDGDAMRVAGEVSENLLRSTKGRLAVDHPRLGVEHRQESGEGAARPDRKREGLGDRARWPGRPLSTLREPCLRNRRASTRTGKEESLPARHPPAVYRQSSSRHDAVQMGMQSQLLAPGMQHRQNPDPGSQVLGIGGDLQQGRRGAAKQQVIEPLRVRLGERVELVEAR